MYKIFAGRSAALKDALGLPSMRRQRFSEFWAVRGIDFELYPGERLGIIGRNGAGKSTLLKLITENIAPSEGRIQIKGQVQALLDTGGGLHPEFTGDENIQAALTFLGLAPAEIAAAYADIAEFTELGRFLQQPFKTYSLGMQARLAFAIATTIRPEILIIDEVLGAGDAYFFAKSAARMRELLDSGAAVVLVSHALDQITRFCTETIWLDRGRIVMRGETVDVVKAYEKFIRELDDRRLRAKNQKARLETYNGFERDSYTDYFTVTLATTTRIDVSELTLIRDGEREDAIAVGSAQDAGTSQPSYVTLDNSAWSNPVTEGERYFRSIGDDGVEGRRLGSAIFYAWFIYPDSTYSVEITYRSADGNAELQFAAGARSPVVKILEQSPNWTTARIELPRDADAADDQVEEAPEASPAGERHPARRLSRWEGRPGLTIDAVALCDEHGEIHTTFAVGRPLMIAFDVLASEPGQFPIVPAVLVFRLDGIVVTRHVSAPVVLDVEPGDRIPVQLDFGPLKLGNGSYVVSIGLYRTIDLADIEPSEFYDYLDKSYEFKVVGNPPLHNELVRHPGSWTIAGAPTATLAEPASSPA